MNNSIGDAGLTAFADAVRSGASLDKLETLFLGENKIKDAGISALADSVSRDTPSAQDARAGRKFHRRCGPVALADVVSRASQPSRVWSTTSATHNLLLPASLWHKIA